MGFPQGVRCYLVRQSEQPRSSVISLLHELRFNEAWLQTGSMPVRGEDWLVLALQHLQDGAGRGGWPVDAPVLYEALGQRGTTLELVVPPGGVGATLGGIARAESRAASTGPLGLASVPALREVTASELMDSPLVQQLAEPRCGDGAEVLFAYRRLAVPAGTNKSVDIFRFSERSSFGIDNSDAASRLCFLALDWEHLSEQVRSHTAIQALETLQYFASHRLEGQRLLGPLSADLLACLEGLHRLDGSMLLREVANLPDLVELLAVANSWLSSPGNRVAYLDQVFFPLLNVTASSFPLRLDRREMVRLSERDLLVAMADQLPYHCPEGTLLESIEDAALRPLVVELDCGAPSDGAIWLLEGTSLEDCLERFDPATIVRLGERFLELWWKAVYRGDDFAHWKAARAVVDDLARETFLATWDELRTLLAVARKNHLRPALLFYE